MTRTDHTNLGHQKLDCNHPCRGRLVTGRGYKRVSDILIKSCFLIWMLLMWVVLSMRSLQTVYSYDSAKFSICIL